MIELFILETCPHSQKVMEYMEENDIKYEKKDISKPENHEKLMELGGVDQVPFLYIPEDDVKMYESDDIIEYLSEYETDEDEEDKEIEEENDEDECEMKYTDLDKEEDDDEEEDEITDGDELEVSASETEKIIEDEDK